MLQHIINALLKAWQMVWDYPSWNMLDDYDLTLRDDFNEEKFNLFTLLSFPVLGLVLSIATMILVLVFSELFTHLGATILFTVTLVTGIEILTKGRNFAILGSYIDNLFINHKTISNSLQSLDDNVHQKHSILAILLVILTFMFRLFLFAILFYKGCYSWFAVAFIANYTMQGYLTLTNNFISNKPILNVDPKKYSLPYWGFAILLLLIIAMFSSKVTITKIIITSLLLLAFYYFIKSICINRLNGINGKIIAFIGFKLECTILLLGLLMFFKAPNISPKQGNYQGVKQRLLEELQKDNKKLQDNYKKLQENYDKLEEMLEKKV